MDGLLAHGFHVSTKSNDLTLWADPSTRLPIRIEVTHPGNVRRIICSEFNFDPDLEESLFSTTAPPGYAVQKTEQDGVNPREEHLIEGLRAIASFLDGQFPAALDNTTIRKAFREHIKQTGSSPTEEDMKALQLKADRAVRYVDLLRYFYKASDLAYAGAGVKLGDALSPIFWWKPRTSESYRVVYGDLIVRDVAPSDLAPFLKK